MNKLKMAHEYFMKHGRNNGWMEHDVADAWKYADAMQFELDKRNKDEAAQKRKEIREMMNAPNTFVEREGQHFDDVEEWQPDWSQAPDDVGYWRVSEIRGPEWVSVEDGISWYKPAPLFDYQGSWQDSLRKRP